MIYWPAIKVVPPPLLVCIELNPGPPKLDITKRAKVIGYLEAGKSISETAKHFNIGKSTVNDLKRKVKQTGSVENRPGQGRKRKLSQKQRRSIKNKAKRGKNAPQITREISHELKQSISVETVRRTIKETKLQYLVVEEEEKLTKAAKEKRVDYATRNSNTDWKLALFTDEKIFQLPAGAHKQWQDPANRMKKTKPARHPPQFMVWAGIGYYFKTPLIFCKQETKLNSEGYLKILKANLPPKTRAQDCPKGKEDDWAFLQDNAPLHKTREIMNYLEQEAPYYARNYPPLSPDFNIIEDIWSQMNTELNKYKITNLGSLKRQMKKIWNEFSWDKVRRSVNSIPQRLQDCTDIKGGRTQY